MVDISYANAYKEVLVVIRSLVKEDYEKIPKEYIEFLEENCNKNYDFNYDTSKNFDQQPLLEDTKYILFGLFEKFGATETQQENIKFLKNNYNNKLEEQKLGFNSEEIFNRKQKCFNNPILDKKEVTLEMTEYNKQKWYQKIFIKILKVFRKK